MKINIICHGLLILLLSSCSFVNLRADLDKQDILITISGTISATPTTSAPIIVVLAQGSSQNLEIILHRVLKQPGNYTFFTDPGTYQIIVFEDSNRNGKYTPPERVQQSQLISATTPGTRHKVDLDIPPRPHDDLLAKIQHIKQSGTIIRKKTLIQVGTVTRLDNPNFSMENASKGLWQPYKSLQEIPFGLFFLQEFDPDKKVILFVHGVSGTPSQFKPIINNLDPNLFQPLVAFYPSGFPLSLISQYISALLDELYANHNLQPVTVVAHSMGGLVSRGVINIQNSHKNSLVDSFISISTPWNGHATASSGLKYAPVVIPVWRDMVPGSDFLEQLLVPPLNTTPHYLLFGFKGASRVAGENSDGVVSIASQLRPISQEQAQLVRGFNEDHVSILRNAEVSKLVNQILEQNLK